MNIEAGRTGTGDAMLAEANDSRAGVLSMRLASQIMDYAQQHNLGAGSHLPTQKLADALRVSRTPIHQALKFLESMDLVQSAPHRGYFLSRDSSEFGPESLGSLETEEDPLYLQIAEDRLSGNLDTRFTESELMRKYSITRNRLLRLLAQMTREGWLERLPGNGWEFQPILASSAAYAESYEYRILIEPAAIRSPRYQVDQLAFARIRNQQQAMLDGGVFRYSSIQTFQTNAIFHETIVRCSKNAFFLDGIQRINRVRRLMEYRLQKDRSRLVHECEEHLQLLNLIEDGRREDAASFLERHLQQVKHVKLDLAGALPAGA